MKRHNVTEELAGKRLDVVAHSFLNPLSRSTVQTLIDDGKILVNKKHERTSYKVKEGDKITVDYTPSDLTIPDIDLPVLYEDDDCIVIHKPVGILSHSKGAFNPEATVASFISDKVNGLEGDRAGIVHRLDRATSGVMICAKNPEALSWLQKQFSQRKTKKTYVTVISGTINPAEAIIDMPIERDPRAPKQFRVGSAGKPAQTSYKVTKTNGTYSLLELKPVTGRTHQIRVHLKQIKHPIVGDPLYGTTPAGRMMLHAKSLEITIPSHERKVFSAPLPPEFNAIMK